jgi:hypothetical protein
MAATTGTDEHEDTGYSSLDRRKAQVPFDGADRRSGRDRRASPRISSE